MIFQDITKVIQCASSAIGELSKEAPSEDVITRNTTEFLKTLEDVERRLLEQINYMSQVTTSQPHEGSLYSAEKSYELAVWKTQFVKSKLKTIGELSTKTED